MMTSSSAHSSISPSLRGLSLGNVAKRREEEKQSVCRTLSAIPNPWKAAVIVAVHNMSTLEELLLLVALFLLVSLLPFARPNGKYESFLDTEGTTYCTEATGSHICPRARRQSLFPPLQMKNRNLMARRHFICILCRNELSFSGGGGGGMATAKGGNVVMS